MSFLNLISLLFWVVVAIQSAYTFYRLRDQGLSRSEVTVVTILLLAGLNISRGLISLAVDIPVAFAGQRLMEYFYIGASMFQILLCTIVLKYIKNNS